MTQKPRVVIDTNKHGIRRETNLDKVAQKNKKRKDYESRVNTRRDRSYQGSSSQQGQNTNS
jgi:hypothetical protein